MGRRRDVIRPKLALEPFCVYPKILRNLQLLATLKATRRSFAIIMSPILVRISGTGNFERDCKTFLSMLIQFRSVGIFVKNKTKNSSSFSMISLKNAEFGLSMSFIF